MNLIRPLHIALFTLMLAAAAAAYYMTPTKKLAEMRPVKLAEVMPSQFEDWKELPNQHVIEVPPETEAFLKRVYSETLSRTYTNSQGDRVMLALAYGKEQGDGNSVHKPEVCYPAQGFTVSSTRQSLINLGGREIKINRITATQGQRIEPVNYWMTVGDYKIVESRDVKIANLKYGFKGVIPDGLLFRISTIDADIERSNIVQKQFITDLYNALKPDAKKILFGREDF